MVAAEPNMNVQKPVVVVGTGLDTSQVFPLGVAWHGKQKGIVYAALACMAGFQNKETSRVDIVHTVHVLLHSWPKNIDRSLEDRRPVVFLERNQIGKTKTHVGHKGQLLVASHWS